MVVLACAVVLVLAVPGVASARGKGDGWPPVTDAERNLREVPGDPEAAAVVLMSSRDGEMARNGRYIGNVLSYHWRLKILKEAGKERAEVHIPSTPYARVSDIQARTIRADGTILEVGEDQIHKTHGRVGRRRGGEREEYVFTFPAAEPGAILEYRYRRQDDFIVVLPTWLFASDEFTLESRVSQAYLSDMGYITLCDKCPDPEPDTEPWHSGKLIGKRSVFTLHNVPPYRQEDMMPPARDVMPRMEMVMKRWRGVYWEALKRSNYLFDGWQAIARYAWFSYEKEAVLGRSALRGRIPEWLQGADDPIERIRRIVRHVRADFRYVESDDVYGRSRPVDDMLATMSADNEEKAVLLASALYEAGFEADMALVSARDRGGLYVNFPSLAPFTHAVVAAVLPGGERVWIDPTVTEAAYDFLPWRVAGAGALWIRETGGELFVLPDGMGASGVTLKVELTPGAAGQATLDVAAEFRGDDALEMRQGLVPAGESDRLSSLKEWVDRRRRGARLVSHQIENLERFDEPLRLRMMIEAYGLVTDADETRLVRGCALSCYDTNPLPPGERHYPIALGRGTGDEESLTVRIPATGVAVRAPEPVHLEAGPVRFDRRCGDAAEGGVQCVRRLEIRQEVLPAEKAGAVRSIFERLLDADRASIAIRGQEPGE